MKRPRVKLKDQILRSGMAIKPQMPIYSKLTYINLVNLIFIVLFVSFAIGNYFGGDMIFAQFEIALAIGFTIAYLLIRITSRLIPTVVVDSLLIYIGASVMVVTGGTGGFGIVWITIVPSIFLNIWGSRYGLLWLLGFILIIITLAVLNTFGAIFVAYSSLQILIVIGAIAVTSILSWVHDYLSKIKLSSISEDEL